MDWKGTLKKYLTRKPSMKARVGKFFLKQALFGGLAVYLGLNLVNYTKAVHVSLKPMDETPFERVIYKKENLPVLEKIIARETTLLKSLKTDVSPQERTPAVVLYRGHFEPKIRALMDVPPAVEKADLQVGRWKGVVNSPLHLYLIGLFLTGAAYFGLGALKRGRYAIIPVYETYERVQELRQKKRGVVTLAGHGLKNVFRTAKNSLFAYVDYQLAATSLLLASTFVLALSNSYNPLTRKATVTPLAAYTLGATPESLSLVAAHEGTHYYQHMQGFPFSRTLWEGHARFVELHLAKEQQRTSGNARYLQESLKREVQELTEFYEVLTLIHRQNPNPAILPKKAYALEEALRKVFIASDGHYQGIVLFKLAEEAHGAERVFQAAAQKKMELLTQGGSDVPSLCERLVSVGYQRPADGKLNSRYALICPIEKKTPSSPKEGGKGL